MSRTERRRSKPGRAAAGRRLLAGAGLAVGLACATAAAWAGTYPNTPGVAIQVGGRNRCASIGDWYTTINGQGGIISSPEPCPTNNGTPSSSTDRRHRYLIEVTAPQLAACGGTCTITVNDAEATAGAGPCDELDGNTCGVAGTGDPARFELRTGDGLTVLASTTVPSGAANGTTVVFSVSAFGFYQVAAEAGSFPIFGTTTANLNNDDNAFTLTVPGSGGLAGGLFGALQGGIQQTSGGSITYDQYFLLGPTAANLSLALRNFDLDTGATVSYMRPSGATVAGTSSGNGVWNNGGSLNAGQDTLAANTAVPGAAPDAGIWRLRLAAWTNTNQTATEANHGTLRAPLFDVIPARAGSFTMTPSTTRSTNIGVARDHPFTVTNQFFTGDIINFSTAGTSASWTVQLLSDTDNDGVGETPLTDIDGDGRVDTGILTPSQTRSFVLRVTPIAGAVGPDVTTINGVSFMDNRVDSANNTTVSVTKTTRIRPTIAKAFSPSTIVQNGTSTITFTLTNRNTTALTGIAFTDSYASSLVNASPLTVGGTCAGVTHTAAAGGSTFNVTAGTVPGGSPSGSCTITVVVTSAAAGSYNNQASGVTSTQTSDGAGPASGAATLLVIVPLTVVKSLQTLSDPFNGTTNPKAIPGATVAYTVQLTNTDATPMDSGTVFITDPVPANTDLFVGDAAGPGSGPIIFTNGATPSGLTYTFVSLPSTTDDVEFSNNGGATYSYTPTPDAGGFDPAVTHLRINPKGVLAGASGGNNPSFIVQFQVRVD